MHHLIIGCLAILGVVLGVPDGPVVTRAVAPVNPVYNPVRNPLGSGYSRYYNSASATAPILTYSNTHGIDGSYSYSYTTGDGKQAQENGFLKDAYIDNIGEPHGTQVKEGSYSYVSPEGTPIQVDYVADENGFRHGGVHIPAIGKGAVPASIFGSQYDARFNYNNPYNYRNLASGYPYNTRYNPYNNYRPFNNAVNTEVKKISA